MSNNTLMIQKVIKRSGNKENISFDKITDRINNLCSDLSLDITSIIIKVAQQITDEITTSDIDTIVSKIAYSMKTIHPDYEKIASRIAVSNLHKNTPDTFSKAMNILYSDEAVSQQFIDVVNKNSSEFDNIICNDNDFTFDFFGFKTLEKSYLLKKSNQKIIERPQYMFLRVSISLHLDNIDKVKRTYDLISNKYYIHATPTLFHAGTNIQQNSSCFLVGSPIDSVEGEYETLKQCALISRGAGGIGLPISDIRCKNSLINTTKGKSPGILPYLKVLNESCRHINQAGRRNGSIAVYLEPWHGDIFSFLEAKKNHGNEEERARDLFYAMWIPDLFMQRVEKDEDWSLMCPNQCKGLTEAYGDEFNKLYTSYENEGKFIKKVRAREVFFSITDSQIETGTPYMLYKDNINKKSNQKNLGTIKSSNLCVEICEYTSSTETAVCNLASICLPSYINDGVFDFNKLCDVTKIIVENLNKVIDINKYPTKESSYSNFKHRPIGIGVQGLSDVFMILKIPFDSPEAFLLNQQIFETIYYGALTSSCELAKKDGPYQSFKGSPTSEGILQYDMWNVTPSDLWLDKFNELKEDIKTHGIRNSLLVAPMPTASTSQIMGFYECFEPISSNLYVRRTLAGEFIIINKYLVSDLEKIGLWSDIMKSKIIYYNGSIQNIDEIPQNIKDIYKTSYEIKQKVIIDMAISRGAFICQSQSMNIFMAEPTRQKLSSLHIYAWKNGLKSGSYYIRSKPASMSQKFSLPIDLENSMKVSENTAQSCNLDQVCEMCSA